MDLSNILSAPVITAFITGVAGPMLVLWYKTSLQKKKDKKKDTLIEEVEHSKAIIHKLEEIKERVQADRVWISQFHNGGNYYPTGKSIQKFSIFYELLEPDVDSIKLHFQGIPVTLFSRSTGEVYKKGYIAIPDFEEDGTKLRYVTQDTECKSYYNIAIFSIDNRFIGTLGVEYVKKKKVLSVNEIKDLEVEAAAIGGVLINYLKN